MFSANRHPHLQHTYLSHTTHILLTSRDCFPRKAVRPRAEPLLLVSLLWLLAFLAFLNAFTLRDDPEILPADPGSRRRCQEIRTLAKEADSPRAHSSCYFRRVINPPSPLSTPVPSPFTKRNSPRKFFGSCISTSYTYTTSTIIHANIRCRSSNSNYKQWQVETDL